MIVTAYLDMFCVEMLLLLRTDHFFKNIPSLQLGKLYRLALYCLLMTTTAMFCVLVLSEPLASFKTTIFRAGTHKQCELTVIGDGEFNLFPVLALSQNLLQAAIVVMCMSKLFRFKL